MPNSIKYSTGSESLALKKGNFYIGIGDVEKGPTETTGYWNGITPPSGGYTIYLNKETNGPSIYCPSNNTELISITNQIAGTNYTAATDCLTYFATQTDKLCVYQDYPSNYPYIVLDGLVLNLDAGITSSYPTSGTTWYDINGLNSKNNGTLTNGPTFNSGNGGSIVFDGADDYVSVTGSITITAATFVTWLRRDGLQTYYDGILFSRSPNATGIGFYSNGFTLSYHWNDAANTWGWNSGLNIPNLNWCMVAVSVTSSSAIAYLCQSNGITSATNSVSHASASINALMVGRDSASSRYFKGNIAQALIYNRALSSTEITQNFNATKNRFGL